jgi:hypothetical protein
MSDWLPVDLTDDTKPLKTFIRGVEVELFASPYDVPEAIRGRFDEDKNRFIIEFKYVGSEKTKVCTFERATYTIGEVSNRLYGLEIDVQALKVDGFGVSVALHQKGPQELFATIRDQATGAIDLLIAKQSLHTIREENYKLAKDAILAKQNELFAVAS